MDVEAIQKRVGRLIEELQTVQKMLSEGVPTFPDGMREFVEKGICLNCRKPLSEMKTRPTRGNHGSCYREIIARIKRGEITEYEAITKGLSGAFDDYWRQRFPDGPPAHPNCRCRIRWVAAI